MPVLTLPPVLPLPMGAWEGWKAGARTPTFTAAPFSRAERWKRPKCPSAEEGIHECGMQINGVSLSLQTEGSSVICDMNEP